METAPLLLLGYACCPPFPSFFFSSDIIQMHGCQTSSHFAHASHGHLQGDRLYADILNYLVMTVHIIFLFVPYLSPHEKISFTFWKFR